jgi:hypothetical protein
VHRRGLALILVVSATAAGALSPFGLRRIGLDRGLALAIASGLGFAGANIATKLASDDVGLGHWPNAAAWGVVAGALGVCATVTGMSAFQRCAATVVVPVSTAVQTFLPIVLEPLFLRERFHSFTTELLPILAGMAIAIAGVVLVGRDPAVGRLAAGG